MEAFLVISNLALWVVVGVQMIVIVMLCKLIAQFLNKFRGSSGVPQEAPKPQLQVGQKAPLFREENQHGEMVRLADHGGERTLLLFTSDTCGICQEIMPKLGSLRQHDAGLRMMVASDGAKGGTAEEKGLPEGVHFFAAPELMANYFVTNVPAYVLVDKDGFILATGTVGTFLQLRQAVESLCELAG